MIKSGAMEMRAISHADLPLMATHEVRLIVLSVVIAVIASYTALDLAGRAQTSLYWSSV